MLPQPSGQKGELKIWNAQTGELILELKGHSAAVITASFSPDQRWIVNGGFGESLLSSGEVRLWDAKSGQEIKDVVGPLASLDIAAVCVVFSPDGQRLVSAAIQHDMGEASCEVKFWDTETGVGLLELDGYPGHRR